MLVLKDENKELTTEAYCPLISVYMLETCDDETDHGFKNLCACLQIRLKGVEIPEVFLLGWLERALRIDPLEASIGKWRQRFIELLTERLQLPLYGSTLVDPNVSYMAGLLKMLPDYQLDLDSESESEVTSCDGFIYILSNARGISDENMMGIFSILDASIVLEALKSKHSYAVAKVRQGFYSTQHLELPDLLVEGISAYNIEFVNVLMTFTWGSDFSQAIEAIKTPQHVACLIRSASIPEDAEGSDSDDETSYNLEWDEIDAFIDCFQELKQALVKLEGNPAPSMADVLPIVQEKRPELTLREANSMALGCVAAFYFFEDDEMPEELKEIVKLFDIPSAVGSLRAR